MSNGEYLSANSRKKDVQTELEEFLEKFGPNATIGSLSDEELGRYLELMHECELAQIDSNRSREYKLNETTLSLVAQVWLRIKGRGADFKWKTTRNVYLDLKNSGVDRKIGGHYFQAPAMLSAQLYEAIKFHLTVEGQKGINVRNDLPRVIANFYLDIKDLHGANLTPEDLAEDLIEQSRNFIDPSNRDKAIQSAAEIIGNYNRAHVDYFGCTMLGVNRHQFYEFDPHYSSDYCVELPRKSRFPWQMKGARPPKHR